MADAAQLKLQVGLDLAFFRQQLAQLGTVAVGYQMPINIKFDRLGIQQELNRLEKNINRRKYRLEVATNIKSETEAAQKLDAALDALKDKTINVKFAGTGDLDPKEARKIRTALSKSILSNGGKIKIPATILAAITQDDVTAFTRAAQAKLKEIALNVRADITSSADGLDTKEVRRIRVALRNAILSNGGKIKIPATIEPSIGSSEVSAFRKLVQEKFKGISVTVGVDAQISGKATATQNLDKAAALEAARQSLARLNPEQLRGRAIKSLGEESGTTKQINQWVDKLKASELTREQKNKQLTGIREYLARAIVDNVSQGIEARMASVGELDPARRGAFPYVAKTGPIEPRVLFAEAAQKAAQIDAQIAAQSQYISQYIAQQKESLRGTATRLLPSAKEPIGGESVQSQAVKSFYNRLRNTEQVFAQNFSANSYLPKASRSLASAMNGAAQQLRMLSATPAPRIAGILPSGEMKTTSRQQAYLNAFSAGSVPRRVARPAAGTPMLPPSRLAGLLPSSDMLAPERFRRAAAKAAEVDAVNTARRQEELKVRAENAVRGKAAATRKLRESFAKLPPIQAPSIGQENAPLSRAATYSLNKARRILGMPIGPSSVYAPNPFAGAATVPPRAPVSGGSGLPPAGTTSNYSAAARRAAWAQAYQQSRPMQAPSVPPPMQPPSPPTPPSGGRGGSSGFGGFANAMAGIQLPGAGLISELGDEFGQAAKQVLLYGAAYKALALLTGFPAQVSEAVAQLQTFNNTLKAITPSSDEFRASNQFILDTVDKYNVPLQSAREGFTNLYASMQPAGFKGNEIRDIFTGVSQAAATFGMSADKVDRVNYAFAQMASKGQVMSEELKGQLGDVLPGAVAIFAKAAGFTGPNAMVDFTKAMEDGRYKGEAMKQLLINVGIVMKDKFAKGAEGAAQSFQGQMNAMATATKKLYESFAPVANLFASNVVKPLTEGLQVVADGFNAFFTGAAAKTGGGFAISQELERLKPTLEGLRANLAGLVPSFQLFGSLLLNVAKALAVVASNPITGFLLKVYANVLLVNTAFTLLGGRILVGLIANIGLATSRLFAMNAAFFALQRTSAVTNSTLAGTQLQMMLLQRNAAGVVGPVNLLLGSLLRMAAIGAIAIAITIAITNADELRDAERRVARLRGERDPVGPEGPKPVMTPARRFTGASRETVQRARAAQAPLVIQYRKELKVLQQQLLTAKAIAASSEDNAQASVANVQAKTAQARVDAKVLDIQNAQGILSLNPGSFKTEKEQQASSLSLPPIPAATDATGSKGSAADDAKRVAEQIKQQLKSAQDLKFEQQNRLTLLRAENDFTKAFTSFSIQRLEIERRYSELLKQSKSPEETAALQQARSAEYKQSSLTLQQQINDLLKQAQAPLNDAVESIKNQAAFEREYGALIKNGTNPEVAKQVIAIRKAYNESVKLLEPALAAAQAAVTKAKAEGASATEIQKYREELEKIEAIRKGLAGKKTEGEAAAVELNKPKTPTETIEGRISTLKAEIAELTNIGNIAIKVADGIGAAFGQAFEGLITGSMSAQEALGNFFKSIGSMFIQMAAEIIAKQMTMIILGFLMKALGLTAGIGSAGNAAGAAAFSPGNSSAFQAIPGQAFTMPKLAANGATFSNGIAKFATGGIVNGPTLFPFADGGAMQMGLMGEAGPEAIMPLQRGADGSLGVRAAMGGNGMGGSSSPVLNMNFETSTINGVEYVSRDQLELAMAQTRRQASRDGANKGMAMTLDKIQQSPQTRRRIGM